MRSCLQYLMLCALVLFLPGCGDKSVTGGTQGILHFDGQSLSDVKVVVYRNTDGTLQPIGFGVTANDGTFQLVTNGAQSALFLSPGEIRCTLESVGVPVQIPKQYSNPNVTPLRIQWSEGDRELNLEATARPTD